MDVAIKIMLFQNSPQQAPVPHGDVDGPNKGDADDDLNKGDSKLTDTRQLVLREAAVCCSMSHPNVVATYHFEVLKASAFYESPSGLTITDKSGEGDFKLYLIQVWMKGTSAGTTSGSTSYSTSAGTSAGTLVGTSGSTLGGSCVSGASMIS